MICIRCFLFQDKIQGKDDLSFGSDIGFPLSSENSSLPSEGESSDRSARGHSEVGASVITDQELAAIQILQVPSSSCKLYSGKQLKSIITSLQKKIDNYDPEEEFKVKMFETNIFFKSILILFYSFTPHLTVYLNNFFTPCLAVAEIARR